MPPQQTPTATPSSPSDTIGATLYWLLGAILVFAPLFRSGQPPLALLVLELISASMLVLILWQPQRNPIPRTQTLALALLFAVPLIYLVPLPAGIAEWFPGREPYAAGRALLAGVEGGGLTRLSLYPLESESAVLFLLLPVAVFLGVRMLDPPRVFQLVILLLVLAALQSLLGLLQYVASEGSPQLFGMKLPDLPSAQGTYTNRNHLAGLLEMVLPITLALMVYFVGRDPTHLGRGWRRRLTFFASARGHMAFVYGAIALLLLLGVIFTRSRTGIALSIFALLLSTIAFAKRIGGNNVYGPTGSVVAFAVGIGIAIGLVPVLDRFSAADAISDARWTIYSATLDGIGAFAPVGSGPGNYPDVFPIFQPPELGRWFINHAHNDYLEWLFEGGILAAALILLLLILYARQWTRVWTKEPWSRFRFVQVAAGIGMLLMLMHSLTDFNLHIPANIAYFAFLAGVFFSEPVEREAEPPRRKRRRTRRLADEPSPSSVPLSGQPRAAMPDADSGALPSPDEDERARASDADEPPDDQDPADHLNLIRKTLARLARRIPVLLLIQSNEASDEKARVSMLRALQHRLTAYTRTIEKLLGIWEEDPLPPESQADPSSAQGKADEEGGVQEEVVRRSEDFWTLQADINALIRAVDLFVDNPDDGDGLSELEEKLGDAEGRAHAIVGESAATRQAAPRAAPRGPALHHQRAQEKGASVKVRTPRPSKPDEQAAPEEQQQDAAPDATPLEPQADGTFDAMQNFELDGIDGRIRLRESRTRLGIILLAIIGGLIAVSWLWPGPFTPLSRDNHRDFELPTDGPADTGDLLLLPNLEASKREAAEPSTAMQQQSADVESPEARVADPPQGTTTEDPPALQDGPAPQGEKDTAPAQPADPVPGDAPGTRPAKDGDESGAPPRQDEIETKSSESGNSQTTDSMTKSAGALTLKEPAFGIQLIAFKDKPIMSKFIRKTELGDNAVYARSSTESGEWYVVLKGFYPSRNQARKAAEALPPKLKRLAPWVKRFPAGLTYFRIE